MLECAECDDNNDDSKKREPENNIAQVLFTIQQPAEEAVKREKLELRKILGAENPADLMTKPLAREAIEKCLGKVNCFIIIKADHEKQ